MKRIMSVVLQTLGYILLVVFISLAALPLTDPNYARQYGALSQAVHDTFGIYLSTGNLGMIIGIPGAIACLFMVTAGRKLRRSSLSDDACISTMDNKDQRPKPKIHRRTIRITLSVGIGIIILLLAFRVISDINSADPRSEAVLQSMVIDDVTAIVKKSKPTGAQSFTTKRCKISNKRNEYRPTKATWKAGGDQMGNAMDSRGFCTPVVIYSAPEYPLSKWATVYDYAVTIEFRDAKSTSMGERVVRGTIAFRKPKIPAGAMLSCSPPISIQCEWPPEK